MSADGANLQPVIDIESILGPLSNPTRQKLLFVLAEGPITYSAILEQLQLKSGSFYWHIKQMDLLVSQTEDKQYFLSKLGKKAYELLIYDHNSPQKDLFFPSWYHVIHTNSKLLFNMPLWIIIQQLLIILGGSIWLFSKSNLLQVGTRPTQLDTSFFISALSICLSVFLIALAIFLMFYSALRPFNTTIYSSFPQLFLKLLLATMPLLIPGLVIGTLIQLGLSSLASSVFLQFILSFFSLIASILLTSAFLDHFLDLGLKDSLLITLPPYYALVLLSFFIII